MEVGMQGVLRVLHLEPDSDEAGRVRAALERGGLAVDLARAGTAEDCERALALDGFDLILAAPPFHGTAALETARRRCPGAPLIALAHGPAEVQGADTVVPTADLDRLAPAIHRALHVGHADARAQEAAALRLVAVVQELSLVRDLQSLMAIVRHAARDLTGADGATFVLRDGDLCHYADEEAIAPLWKGLRFPMSACISGWAMLHKEAVALEDIYADPRIPADAYRPTFVKSLAMVPIRKAAPIGAIGNYWAKPHRPTAEEMGLLQALADSTSIAMENLQLYGELEQRVAERTAQLEAANKELESFSFSVSHDLRAPVRAIDGFGQLLRAQCGEVMDDTGRRYLDRVLQSAARMGQLIEDLLRLSRINRAALSREAVDLSRVAADVVERLQAAEPGRQVEVRIEPGLSTQGDGSLLRAALENLLGNAWKYSSRKAQATIAFGAVREEGQPTRYFVQDDGAGFEMAYADRLFGAFQRLHSEQDFPGNGVGLATVQRIIHRHGGRIWAEAEVDKGATFSFTLP
jgi:signal transduction histidine kinase